MRKIIVLLLIVCAWVNIQAQTNLVRNASFETHWRCPQYFELVKYANYWSSISDTVKSGEDTLGFYPWYYCLPEYCNVCSSNPVVRIPDGQSYTHYARTGEGMMQLLTYYNEYDPTFRGKRDYLQGRLKNNLIAGEQYCVTFYTCLEGGSAYAINNISAYFDDATIDTITTCGLPQSIYTPQISEMTIITDTLNWTKVQGTFTATGNESFITMGNFSDAEHTDTVRMHFPHANSLTNQRYTWHLIDDVSVIKVGTVANAGNDTAIYTGDTAWIGEHVGYTGDSAWHNDYDDYAPVKWYTATGILIDSNHAGLHVHPATTTSYVMELDVCGTITHDTVTVHVHGLGIDGMGMAKVKVYPNPASDEVHVSGVDVGTNYRLLNAVGVVVQSGTLIQKDSKLSLMQLPTGIYILSLIADDGSKGNFRIIKQ